MTDRRIWGAIFLSSLAALSFEVLLLRIFSIALWQHFASLVLSIAMLGVAVSGTLVALAAASRRRPPRLRAGYFLLLGIAMPLSYTAAAAIPFDPAKLSWDSVQLLWISCYYLALSAPFLVAGFILASAFASRGEMAGTIYAADLGGAAAGAATVMLLQAILQPGPAVAAVALLPLLAALLCGGQTVRAVSLTAGALLLALVLKAPGLFELKISPYKELPSLLRMRGAEHYRTFASPYGRADLFYSPGARYAPGLSLRFHGELPPQVSIAVDGGSVTSLTPAAGKGGLSFLDYLPSSLPYRLRPGGRTFLADPRGGLPLLLAQRHGADVAGCAESQPVIPAVIRRSGQGLAPPCTRRGLARNILTAEQGRYDIVDLPLTDALPSARSGGGADYRLTVEAFETYLGALDEDGILAVSLYVTPPYRSEIRIFATLLRALEESGAAEPRRHLAAIRSLGLLLLIASRRPFTDEEIGTIDGFAGELWFDTVWSGGRESQGAEPFIRSRSGDLAGAYRSLADPGTREDFVRDYLFDITPPEDDRPFFHDHLRLATVDEVFRLVEGKWDFFITAGGLLPVVFVQVAVLGLVLVILPTFASGSAAGGGGAVMICFAALGAAYMMVEVGLIERFAFPLEHPVRSFALVVSALLVGSGLGSWQSRSFGARRLPAAAAAAALCAAAACLGSAFLAPRLGTFPPAVRWAALWIFVFPLGWVMGVPFPCAVRHLSSRRRDLIPWAWAMNGFCSVLAPLLAAMLARGAGTGAVFVMAAVAYGAASLAGRSFCASPTMGTKRTPPI